MMVGRESGELNQILIDRISPEDVRSLKDFAGLASVKGSRFGRFAAFLSRAYRENDYLLARLHGLDRLIDIVCDSPAARATASISSHSRSADFCRSSRLKSRTSPRAAI